MDSWHSEKGTTLGLAALAMMVLLGMVALAIDVGMIMTARTEAQRAADAAALAAAGAAYITGPSGTLAQEQLARETAVAYAAKHEIMNEQVTLEPDEGDVTFPGPDSVRVRVRRTPGVPEGAIETIFARVVGFSTVNVTADATARVTGAGSTDCPLPLVILDKWEGDGDPPPMDATYDPNNDPDGVDDEYRPPSDQNQDPTGWDESDVGVQIRLKSNNTNPGTFNPSWWGAWRPPGQQGADDYRENIYDCVDPSLHYEPGDNLTTEQGGMRGPTRQGFQDLIDQDPKAHWDEGLDCVVGGPGPEDDRGCELGSPRIKPVLMIAPTGVPPEGQQQITALNWAGMFIENVTPGEEGEFVGRFMKIAGEAGGGSSSSPDNSLVKAVQLVE